MNRENASLFVSLLVTVMFIYFSSPLAHNCYVEQEITFDGLLYFTRQIHHVFNPEPRPLEGGVERSSI
jgi:hypothetical protein